jgi:beta-glucosidase-like glycosyl hydrolase
MMVAHLACPGLGDGELPATLAPRIATDLLRGTLGFTGVAVTDSMDMQGVSGHFGPEDAAVRAMLAGCDLLLYCFDLDLPRAARGGLQAALASGRLPRARLQEASQRVAALRRRVAVDPVMLPPQAALPDLETDAASYRGLCRRALRIESEPVWDRVLAAARVERRIDVHGAQAEVVDRFASRLQARGWSVNRAAESTPAHAGALVLLAERRPLGEERLAPLRAAGAAGAVLVNVLTPEVDAPIAGAFGCAVRTADHSDAMLDVMAARLAGDLG